MTGGTSGELWTLRSTLISSRVMSAGRTTDSLYVYEYDYTPMQKRYITPDPKRLLAFGDDLMHHT